MTKDIRTPSPFYRPDIIAKIFIQGPLALTIHNLIISVQNHNLLIKPMSKTGQFFTYLPLQLLKKYASFRLIHFH